MYGGESDPAVLLLIAVGYGLLWAGNRARSLAGTAVEHVREWRRADPAEAAREAYAAGEIGEQELERRLDWAMDENNERIKQELMNAPDVGSVVAAEVAVEYRSLAHVERASVDELADVQKVGAVRAESIAEYLDGRF